MLYYFAYGSNLHPVRLLERVPSAQWVGRTELRYHRLAFQKRGSDGSSKCDLVRTGEETDGVYGAIYQMDSVHKQALDCFEGNGNGYYDSPLTVELHGKEHSCFTYFAKAAHIADGLKPYHWYKELALAGAIEHGLPRDYVESIRTFESVEDPTASRRELYRALLDAS